jgi:hypothetical protein
MTLQLDPPSADDAPQSPPPAPERGVPAGRVIAIGVVALLLAALLNSQSLLDLARSQPEGSRVRSVATGVAEPLHDFASAIGLTKPREVIDGWLGRDEPGSDDADVTVVAGSAATTAPGTTIAPAADGSAATTAPGAATTAPPATTAAPATTAVPTPAGTNRVLVAGDSMAQGLAALMQPLATAAGLELQNVGKASTGLTRPDYYDWPAHLKDFTAASDPGVVVLMYGGNDGQPIKDATGKAYQVTDPGWSAEYGRRVGAVMDQLGQEGRKVIWVGTPNAQSANMNNRLKVINAVLDAQAATRPWVHIVDAWTLFSGPNGSFVSSMTDTDGKVKRVRGKDGYHLTVDGYKRLARAVQAEVDKIRAGG